MVIADPPHWKEKMKDKGPKYTKILEMIAAINSAVAHDENHILGTSGPHTGTLPLADLAVGSAGSIIRRGASDWEELVKGSNGSVLTMGATYPSWVAPSGGGITKIFEMAEWEASTNPGNWTLYTPSGEDLGATQWYNAGYSNNRIRQKESFSIPTGITSLNIQGYFYISGLSQSARGGFSKNGAGITLGTNKMVAIGGSVLDLYTISVVAGDRIRCFVQIGTVGAASWYCRGIWIIMT